MYIASKCNHGVKATSKIMKHRNEYGGCSGKRGTRSRDVDDQWHTSKDLLMERRGKRGEERGGGCRMLQGVVRELLFIHGNGVYDVSAAIDDGREDCM